MAELNININIKTTSLLVMDCQKVIVGRLTPDERQKVLTNLGNVTQACRKAGIQIIYVLVRFRDGYPEVHSRNALFQGVKGGAILQESDPNSEVCDEIAPQAGDLVVTKKRISAFTGSDLATILRAKGIDTLVLSGISSLGVVESTARFAVDMDYRVIVLEDCCSDANPEAHQIAVQWLLPYITTVCSTQDFLKALK